MNVVANQLYFLILCPSILLNMVNVSKYIETKESVDRYSWSQNSWKIAGHLGTEGFFGQGNQNQKMINFGLTQSSGFLEISISKNFTLETKPKFEVNQTYPTCTFSEHAFCAAPVMRNFTNKGCDCFPGKGF